MQLNKGEVTEVYPSLLDELNKDGYTEVGIKDINTCKEIGAIDITTENGFFENKDGILMKNCSAHSLRAIAMHGLGKFFGFDIKSSPAKHAQTLVGHLNTFMCTIATYYAGAIGIDAVNTYFAPYVHGMNKEEMKQIAQYLIFSLSQSSFSRGGQCLFSDFNLFISIPEWQKKIQAVGPGGVLLEDSDGNPITYSYYEKTAREFLISMLEVYKKGDANGEPFPFPKCNLHVSDNEFEDPEASKVLEYACEVSAHNGAVYFIFDHDSTSLAACCRLRTKIDMSYLENPERIRFSFPRNEMIIIRENSKVRVLSYGRLFDEVDSEILLEDGYEIKYVHGLEIWDENRWTPLVRVLRHKKTIEDTKKLMAIRTTGGKLICTTSNHPMIVQDTNKPENCPKCNSTKIAPFGKSNNKQIIRCSECGKYTSVERFRPIGENKLIDAKNVNTHMSLVECENPNINQNVSIEPKLAYLLGVYLGDGHLSKNAFHIAGLEESKTMKKVKTFVSEINDKEPNYCVDRYTFSLKELHSLVDYKTNAYMKQLPDDYLYWDIQTFGDVVSGLIDTDGCIDDNRVTIGSISKIMLSQIQMYLDMIGIRTLLYMVNKAKGQTYHNRYTNKLCDCHPSFVLELPRDEDTCKLFRMSEKLKSVLPKEYNRLLDDSYIIRGIDFFEDRKEEYVYDITTESHTFVSNGILLHNCGFQNVTTNLAQCAYRSGKDKRKFFSEIRQSMDLCMKAHIQKKNFISKLGEHKGSPLYALLSEKYFDGEPYVDLEKATYIFGIAGLNEAVQYMLGQELHESEDAHEYGLDVITFMYTRLGHYNEKHGLKVVLEESPAESAIRRFAKTDVVNYPEAKGYVRGNIETGDIYYTNSIHFRADSNVDIVQRIMKQSEYHSLIEAGAIIHVFCGEHMPSAQAIFGLVEKTHKNTECAQWCVSPDFTICKSCSTTSYGLKENCSNCGNTDVKHMSRVVGYFSIIENWNNSKKEEHKDRHKGDYGVR